MTTANKITIGRILLVPFFIVQVLAYLDTENEWYRITALLSFLIAAISDGVDGYLARRYNQRSELGRILDPLADKLLLVSGVLLLSFHHATHLDRIPFYMTATVLTRDILLVLGLLIIHLVCNRVRVGPVLVGKVSTVLQMSTVIWVLLKWPTAIMQWLAAAVTLTTGVSGAYYVLDGIRQLNASPSSAASPKQ